MHFMYCVSGFSGVGKDEFCRRLVLEYNAVQTGLADPMKRHLIDVYGFSEQQMFGPSMYRNSGDARYPKNVQRELELRKWEGPIPEGIAGDVDPGKQYWVMEVPHACGSLNMTLQWMEREIKCRVGKVDGRPYVDNEDSILVFIPEGDPIFWLSPREALQLYGELLNNLYLNTWVRKGIEDQRKVATGKYSYNRMSGLVAVNDAMPKAHIITCFADFRHINEIELAESTYESSFRTCVPVLIRVKSQRVPRPPYNHRSETEQATIPDNRFHFVVQNDGSVQDLHDKVDKIVTIVTQSYSDWASQSRGVLV